MNPLHPDRARRLLFELGALPYDWLTAQEIWRDHCARMLDPLGDPTQPRVVMDLGCGPGVSALALHRRFPGDRVMGLDLSAPMLRRARDHCSRAGDPLPLVQGSALQLPLRTSSVDVLTGHSFLYLLPSREVALAEMLRVLRPGGHVVLLEPAREAALSRVLGEGLDPRFLISMVLWRVVSGRAGRFSPESLTALFQRCGFETVDVSPTLAGMGLNAIARKPLAQRPGRPS